MGHLGLLDEYDEVAAMQMIVGFDARMLTATTIGHVVAIICPVAPVAATSFSNYSR